MRSALAARPLRLLRVLPCVLLLTGVVSCLEDGDGGGGGQLEVFTSPEGEAFTDDTLIGGARLAHSEGTDVLFVDWEWTVDGVFSGITDQSVPPEATTKGEVWQVSARADDGTTVTERTFSDEVTILNSLPLVTPPVLRPLNPSNSTARCVNSTLFVNAFVSDLDGDPTTLLHDWRVNNVSVATTPTLAAPLFAVGDTVRLNIRANDGEADGPTVSSNTVTIISCETALQQTHVGSIGGAVVSSGLTTRVFSAELFQRRTASLTAVRIDDTQQVEVAAAAELARSPSPLSISEQNVCNIAADGALVCTGSDAFGLNEPPEGAFLQVKVTHEYACAIRATDAGIACWGAPSDDVGQLSPPEGAFSQLDLGAGGGCAVRTSGEIACWGDEALVASAPEGRFTHVDVTDADACAIAADGGVHCWGDAE